MLRVERVGGDAGRRAVSVWRSGSSAGARFGVSSSLFFGHRTFNPISSFDFTLGMALGGHWGLGASHERSVSVGLQLDLTLIVAAFAG